MFHRLNTLPNKVAGIYLVISVVYILVSDGLVEAAGLDKLFPAIQTAKGLIFVFLSALLIHCLISKELRKRKVIEQQLMRAQRMEAVGELTSGVAHDFNNFLTVILGNLDLILQDAGNCETLRKRAGHALLATERGADLTRRLLAFSCKQSLEPRPVDVNACIRQMKMLLGSVLGEGITVEADLAPDLPQIIADPGQFETAVLNLALNARDAMPDGGVIVLSTSVVRLDADQKSGQWHVVKGHYVKIAVNDDGHGMPQHVLEQVAEPFLTTKAKGKGSGLGFPMAHRFVKRSGGHVTVCSAVGRGTTVTLYFPVTTPPEQSAARPDTVAPVKGGKETVLLVENDAGVRGVLGDILTCLGYRVLLASGAREAHAFMADEPRVDLLMTDIILGGKKSGIELTNEVRKTNPSVSVLVMSGYADSTITERLSDPARSGWLAKPFSRQTVARRIRELLDA